MNPPPGIEALPNNQWVVEGDTHFAVWAKQHGNIITDPNLMKWLYPHLYQVGTIWDIGANIGDHTRQYLDWGKYVVAIEPHPVAFECLRHNCPEALCLNFAASDVTGTVNFAALDNVGASRIRQSGEWTVPAQKLDDHPDLPAPGFVKADCEGWEPMVLAGMRGIIERHRPMVFIEINRGALAGNLCTPEDIYRFFLDLGYSVESALIYPPRAALDSEQFDILFLP